MSKLKVYSSEVFNLLSISYTSIKSGKEVETKAENSIHEVS